MSYLKIKKTSFLNGIVRMPGDKSISHRAIIMTSLARGRSSITGLLESEDVNSTIDVFRKLGVRIALKKNRAVVQGAGLFGLKEPRVVLDAGNSGTTARLVMGVLAGQSFTSTVTGDKSLRKRPMARITKPLRRMGARISGPKGLDRLPLSISGGNIEGIIYTLPVPSAQVKSSVLLAGLFSRSPVTIIEPVPSRDHTERIFRYFGIPVKKKGEKTALTGVKPFKAKPVTIPGDISSAAFFIVAGILLKGSCITIQNVGLNPLRIGMIKILKCAGAKIKIRPHLTSPNRGAGKGNGAGTIEPYGDIIIDEQPPLKPFHLKAKDIPCLIDEIPILAVLATQIKGTSTIRGAEELRVKETDRIRAIAWNLKQLGADIRELPDGLIIKGKNPLYGNVLKSFGDHRMAMSMAVAGLISEGETKILDTDCIKISFPGFVSTLKKCGANLS